MLIGATTLPWMGISARPRSGVTYAAEIWPLAIAVVATIVAACVSSMTRPSSPMTAVQRFEPKQSSAVIGLVGLGVALGSNLVAELLSVVSIGRSALEFFEGEPVKLLPGPGQLLFTAGAVGLIISSSGRPVIATITSWISNRPLGPWRSWVLIGGVTIVVLSRLDTWIQVPTVSMSGAEIPFLGQILGVLVLGVAICAAATLARGGVAPRLIGGLFGICLACIALFDLVAVGRLVDTVPVDDLQQRLTSSIGVDQADTVVEEVADSFRESGPGTGPVLALVGISLITLGAAIAPWRRRPVRAVVSPPPTPTSDTLWTAETGNADTAEVPPSDWSSDQQPSDGWWP
jgi:hypothetical protein